LGHPPRFSSIARIESRLPAASLSFVKFDRATGPTQHIDSTRANAAPHLIDQTSDE
jgi:hypothetical protein